MALFSECMQQCAKKVLDTAGIVREAIFRQLPANVLSLRFADHTRGMAGPQTQLPDSVAVRGACRFCRLSSQTEHLASSRCVEWDHRLPPRCQPGDPIRAVHDRRLRATPQLEWLRFVSLEVVSFPEQPGPGIRARGHSFAVARQLRRQSSLPPESPAHNCL